MNRYLRSSIVLFVFLIGSLLLTACNESSDLSSGQQSTNNGDEASETFELKFGHASPQNHPTTKALEWMAEELSERTEGHVKLDIYPGSALGGPDELVQGLNTGDVDFAWIATGSFARHVKLFGTFSISYLIDDREHYQRVTDPEGDVMKYLSNVIDNELDSISLVGMMGGTPRVFYNSSHKVETLEDIKGMSVRIQDSPTEALIWTELGASVQPLAADEVYQGLQTNVVTGAESSVSNYYTEQYYQIAPYLSLTNHQFVFMPVLMSDKTYDELPSEYQDIVMDLIEEASLRSHQIYWDEEDDLLAQMEEEGVTITRPDLSQFKEVINPLQDEIAQEVGGEDLLELINEERD